MNTKSKPRIDKDIENYVCETIIQHLSGLFQRSKFKPGGGFRQGYGYSFKTYGLLSIITVNASPSSYENNQIVGRVTINTGETGTEVTRKRFSKIIKALNGNTINDILFDFEINCANGHSYWFKFTIN